MIQGTNGADSLTGTAGDDQINGDILTIRLQGIPGNFSDGLSQVTGLADGGYVVTWEGATSDGQGSDIFSQQFDANGSQVGSLNRLQGEAGNNGDYSPQVLGRPDGGYVIAWYGGSGYQTVFAQQFDASGTKVGTQIPLSAGANTSNGYPAMTNLADGGYLIAWEMQQNGVTYTQRFDADGTAVGAPKFTGI